MESLLSVVVKQAQRALRSLYKSHVNCPDRTDTKSDFILKFAHVVFWQRQISNQMELAAFQLRDPNTQGMEIQCGSAIHFSVEVVHASRDHLMSCIAWDKDK